MESSSIKKTLFLLLFFTHLYASQRVDYDYELDAYYTNVSAFINLDKDANITDATHLKEHEIYKKMLLNTLHPNIFLIEASINPMGFAGIYTRKNEPDIYKKSELKQFNNMNLIQAVTAGFDDPYCLSFFVGRMMIFKNKKSDHIGKNRAYLGYLVSVGDRLIKDNTLHDCHWIDTEFKLKGTRKLDETFLDWSFRVGAFFYDNPNFVNRLYVGARRSHVDFDRGIFSFLYNSDFNAIVYANSDTLKLNEAKFSIAKEFPVHWPKKMSFSIELGYLYTANEKYRGVLKDEGVNNHQLILHPNLKW